MAYSVSIFYGQQAVGTLSLTQDTGLLRLEYTTNWQQQGFAITPSLSLGNTHTTASVFNYLDNLLPEGEARLLLAQSLGVSERNVYAQIHFLGHDLAGAFSFRDEDADSAPATTFRPLGEAELIQRLAHKEDLGLLHWGNKPRLSVAGVQDKLNVFIHPDGQMGFGEGALCSTHILKFEKPSCPHLVLNEFFCMRLSRAVGLPTATVAFKRFGEHPALQVERFDRRFDAQTQRVQRRHVIDGCQALNLPRDYKYERNLGDGRDVQHIRDGASLSKLFEFCQHTASPVSSKQWLIRWQLFNLMISNYDSHGKNVSFFYHQARAQFTPAYDLVNIAMFKQFKHSLAMGMGDEFDPENINAYQLTDFAESCDIDKKLLGNALQELGQKVLGQLSSLTSQLSKEVAFDTEELRYLQQLTDNIQTRTEHLLTQAQGIPDIRL